MKIKTIIYIIFFLLTQLLFGQNKVVDSCYLKTKNTNWKTSFENAETSESKLKFIREKIVSDSIYSEYKPKLITRCSPSLYAESVDKNGNNCGVKILFTLNYTKKKSVTLDLNKNPEYIFIVEKLNEINIQKIYPIFDDSAQALYGGFGKSGVIILISENRKFAKEINSFIKKLEKKNRKKNRTANRVDGSYSN